MSDFSKKAIVVIIAICIISLIYERPEVTAFMIISQLGLVAGALLFD